MVLINILVGIAVFACGVGTGILINSINTLKDLTDINARVDRLSYEYNKSIERSDTIIEHLKNIAQKRHELNNLYEQDYSLIYGRLIQMIETNDFSGANDLLSHIDDILGILDDDGSEEASSDE